MAKGEVPRAYHVSVSRETVILSVNSVMRPPTTWAYSQEFTKEEAGDLMTTPGERAVYFYLRTTRGATRARVLEETGMNERSLDRAMKQLRSKGLIVEAK